MRKFVCKTIYLILILFLHSSISVPASDKNENKFLTENSDAFLFNNKNAKLLLNKQTFKIELIDNNGKVRFSEYQRPSFFINENWIEPSDKVLVVNISENSSEISINASNSSKIKLVVEKAGDNGFSLKYSFPENEVSKIKGIILLNSVEEIYGFGETWNKHLAQRGQAIEIWDKGGTPDECGWMPYYVSTQNYAFYINYGGRVKFDVGRKKSDELTYEMETNELEYTVLLGDNIASCVQNYISMTGMPAKPPRWAFEPWFWLMSDPDIPGGHISTLRGEHFLEMIDSLEKLDIPIGVTWLEPPWQDARTTFIPNKEFCPDLKGLIADIAKHGVKTLAWTVPYTSPGASNWEEAVNNSYLVKKPGGETEKKDIKITVSGELEGTFYNKIDYYNPEAFKWWQQQIEKSLDLGLKGYKLDAGQALPSDGLLYDGRLGKDHHNSIALEYNKVFYEVLNKKFGDDFLMIPRAAWIGSQAFTNFKWPGDLDGNFASNGLPSSIYSSLSLALSGMPFVSTDIGGFSHQPAPEEPWIRWAQFGAMLPGMQTLHMPWWYSEKAKDHYRYLAWLHTDMIPYWQSLANQAHEAGTPICRPLVWDYQDDQETWYIDDEFTVGEYILVAPFVIAERMRQVYLPEGTWFDFWNEDEVFEGKKKVSWFKGWNESMYKFPLYIKEGAVIPLEIKNDVSGFGTKFSEGFITLAMWPEKNAKNEFILNDSEGAVLIATSWQDNSINITVGKTEKDYLYRIHLKEGYLPSDVNADKPINQFNSNEDFQKSKTDGWYFDKDLQKLWIKKYNGTDSGSLKIGLK